MNKLKEMFERITDSELMLAIGEIKESDITGTIPSEGIVRKYAKLSGEITGGFTTTDFYLIQVNILKEAAYRWYVTETTQL